MAETHGVTKVVIFTCLFIENINKDKKNFDIISIFGQNIRDCEFSVGHFEKWPPQPL